MNLAPASSHVLGGSSVAVAVTRNVPKTIQSAMPTATALALQRMEDSRSCIRRALASSPIGQSNDAAHPPSKVGDLLVTLRAVPAARVLMDAISAWWAMQPVGKIVTLGAAATTTLMKPVAQRHPYALVVGALLFGGALAWSKPWRWLMRPTPLAHWLPRFAAGVAAQIPLSVWVELLRTAQGNSPATRSMKAGLTAADRQ